MNNGKPVRLGGRTFDVLVTLAERAGAVVSKEELMELVWPGVTVDEGALRVHIASLRKALNDESPGAEYVATLQGRGYCFVAPIARSDAASHSEPLQRLSYQLPARLSRMVGRQEVVEELSTQVLSDRFVTIVGPGGIGKTTVAIEAGHALYPNFDGAAFFDLGPLGDPLLVASAVASTLGLRVQSKDPMPGLIAHLRNQRLLLILDSCEHVIDAAAALAERIFLEAPNTHIMATSREALRVDGERVWRLAPLDSPPDEPGLTAATVLGFTAPQLFVERANASGSPFELRDSDASAVGEICRRLDGIALAIELVARRVDAYGVQDIARLLNDRLELIWEGRRTALPRHQTLRATLDWSYDALREPERVTLRWLAVFVGVFTLEAARAVARGAGLDGDEVVGALAGLVAKSLITADVSEASTHYRLLDTTRAYALGRLLADGDSHQAARLHAVFFLQLLERTKAHAPSTPDGKVFSMFAPHLGNVRTALKWALLERGDIALGLALAAASAPLFLELSLVAECSRWTRQAIEVLDASTRGTRVEMELHIHHGISSMLSEGNSEPAALSLKRSLELAGQLDDQLNEFRTLGRLSIFHLRAGEMHATLEYAGRFLEVAKKGADPISRAEAHGLLGGVLHIMGSHPTSRFHIEAALSESSTHLPWIDLGYNQRSQARIILAGLLWMEGAHRQAQDAVRQALEEAEGLNHPPTTCMVLAPAIDILLRAEDLEDVERHADRLIQLADKHMLTPYQAVGRGAKGELLVRREQPEQGVAQLRSAVEMLDRLRYKWVIGTFMTGIARGLAAINRFGEAIDSIDGGLAAAERDGILYFAPEMLRVKGWILMSAPEPAFSEAEGFFERSLDLATRQGALAWQLRTATSLALLRLRQGRRDEIREILAPICDRFAEHEDHRDLAEARRLLAPP